MVVYNTNMPLSKSGQDVMHNMMKEYGTKKGKSVFYASINKGKKGSEKWHMDEKKMKQHVMAQRAKGK